MRAPIATTHSAHDRSRVTAARHSFGHNVIEGRRYPRRHPVHRVPRRPMHLRIGRRQHAGDCGHGAALSLQNTGIGLLRGASPRARVSHMGTGCGGFEGGAQRPPRQIPMYAHWVGWLMTSNVRSQLFPGRSFVSLIVRAIVSCSPPGSSSSHVRILAYPGALIRCPVRARPSCA